MRSPRRVEIDVTSRCNLRCRYCYFFDDGSKEHPDLPAKEWLPFFDECGDAGVMEVQLAGGEPFIREDLPELIDGIVRNRMRFSILSNGGLIDEPTAERLAATGRCNLVQVSVDGSRPEVHDTLRGKGSFDGALRGIRVLQKHTLPVTVRVTIHRHNVDNLEATARLLLEELGLPSFSTNAAGCLGSCRLNPDDVLLSTSDRQRAMETLLRLEKKWPGRITAQAGPLAEARIWTAMQKGGQSPISGGRLTACGCPFQSIAVRPDGVYVPCTMLSGLELGRIGKDALLDVWKGAEALVSLRRRNTIDLETFEECRECSYRTHCTGNCPGLAYSLTGEVDRPSPDACLKRFLEDGGKVATAPHT
jgi:SynChlorMet cassette radical SAM/SPASM protein ScmE